MKVPTNRISNSGAPFALHLYVAGCTIFPIRPKRMRDIFAKVVKKWFLCSSAKTLEFIQYHFSDCWRIGKSRIPMSLENAIDKGFEPCPWCEPPERLTEKPELPVYSGEEHDFEAYRAFRDENRMAYELQDQLDQAEVNDILFAHSQTFGAKLGFTAPTIFWVAVFAGIFVVIVGICVFAAIKHSSKNRAWHEEFR